VNFGVILQAEPHKTIKNYSKNAVIDWLYYNKQKSPGSIGLLVI